nr:MAG TPA: hypothetical protein [Caudoviricetes sp.]
MLSKRLFILLFCIFKSKLYMQFRLYLHKPLNIGIYKFVFRTLVTSFSSAPPVKKVCISRCSFYIFLYSLDKGYLFPDFPRFTEFIDSYNLYNIDCTI